MAGPPPRAPGSGGARCGPRGGAAAAPAWRPPRAAQGRSKAGLVGGYGAASRALRGGDPARPLAAHEGFAAGGVAGGANALVLAPVELSQHNRLWFCKRHAFEVGELRTRGVPAAVNRYR